MELPRSIAKILNCLQSQLSQNKPLLFATIISLLLHIFLLTKFAITLPELNEGQQALEMRLVNLQPTQESTPVSVKQSTPKPEPTPSITPEKVAETDSALDSNTDAEAPSNTENSTAALPPVIAPQKEQIPESTTTEPSPTEIIESTDTIDLGDIANKPTPKVYQYVETEFEVTRGSGTTAVGVARIVFNIQNENTYKLTSSTEAKGLAALIFGKLQQVSEGTITENGIRPNYYSYQYGSNDEEKQHADFAWSDGVVEMNSKKGKETGKLTEGTQDLLSFMYQFMFTPPLGNMQIHMTNGKNLRTYAYSLEGEEPIITKFGNLKTIHLLKKGVNEEKTEIWLALDYQYLPVKIRKTEKNGSVIEQTATYISTDRPE